MSSVLPRTIDGITYDLLRPGDDVRLAADLAAQDFCLHEPCCRSLKIPPEESTPVLLRLCRRGAEDGVSLKAVDDATGDVVAVRVAFARDKGRKAEDEELYDECVGLIPERWKPFADFLCSVSGEAGETVFEDFNVDKYVEFFFVNVREDYRGRQVAQKILSACYDLYREKGYNIVKVIASNPRTVHIFLNKQGFKQIANFKVLDFQVDGKPFFQGIQETEFVPTLIKDLRE